MKTLKTFAKKTLVIAAIFAIFALASCSESNDPNPVKPADTTYVVGTMTISGTEFTVARNSDGSVKSIVSADESESYFFSKGVSGSTTTLNVAGFDYNHGTVDFNVVYNGADLASIDTVQFIFDSDHNLREASYDARYNSAASYRWSNDGKAMVKSVYVVNDYEQICNITSVANSVNPLTKVDAEVAAVLYLNGISNLYLFNAAQTSHVKYAATIGGSYENEEFDVTFEKDSHGNVTKLYDTHIIYGFSWSAVISK